MPSHQKHRGTHPKDEALFCSKSIPDLANAVSDLNYLLSKAYGDRAAFKIVGDHYNLKKRQRLALSRISCSSNIISAMNQRELKKQDLDGKALLIDGFNILILAEVCLSKGMIFESSDGCYRDIASVHGSYNKVRETPAAITQIGKLLDHFNTLKVRWFLDAPVSNSGRLKQLINEVANLNGWSWEFFVVNNPDKTLKTATNGVVLSSDRYILSECQQWFNFSKYFVESYFSSAPNIVKLKHLGL